MGNSLLDCSIFGQQCGEGRPGVRHVWQEVVGKDPLQNQQVTFFRFAEAPASNSGHQPSADSLNSLVLRSGQHAFKQGC